jgi:uncharacterized MAPEG superfamily protein
LGVKIEGDYMQQWLTPYVPTIFAMAATAALLLVQLLVVDLASIRARHVPGTPVDPNHNKFLFRATRAHANTNESIAGFVLLALFGVLSAASAGWLNALSWVYVLARLAHMLCYYTDVQLPRSVSFGIGLAALFGMLMVGLSAWVS